MKSWKGLGVSALHNDLHKGARNNRRDKLIKSHSVCKESHWVTCVSILVTDSAMQLLENKKYPLQRRLIAEQKGEAERWTSKAITEPSHINWKKNHYIWCARSNEVSVALCQVLRVLLPNITDHDSDRMQDLSWQHSCCLQQRIRKHINIYLDICHAESWCLWTTARRITSTECNFFLPTAEEITGESLGSVNTFANILF